MSGCKIGVLIRLDPPEIARLKDIAAQRGISVPEVIRQAARREIAAG